MRRAAFPRWPRHAEQGSSVVEFALVLPVFLFFLLGIIDVGRLMWTWNEAEKATQMGARMAAVTDMVPGGLYTADFTVTLNQGQPVPVSSFGSASCSKSGSTVSCTCTGTCPTLTPYNSASFNSILARMQGFLPSISLTPTAQDPQVTILYANSGLGYAGDPNGADVAPLITVSIGNVVFSPLVFQLFGASITLPTNSASLTMEDGQGTVAN